jgi:SagB-type dehydrogenase family enzyme
MSWRGREESLLFHERTKHSPLSLRSSPHFLDWDNQPLPYKIYRGVESDSLPAIAEPEGMDALTALAGASMTSADPGARVDLDSLGRLLFHTAGITKRLRIGGREMEFRAAACTGALYHVEIYVAAGDVDGLGAGLHHYDPRGHALDRLRHGDVRSSLFAATGGEPRVARADVVLVLTTTFWRNSWKYRSRAYRHAFWDSGTMLANLFAMGAALRISAHLVLGFADEDVCRIVDVDPDHEAAVAVVALGESRSAPPPAPLHVAPLGLPTEPLSRAEVDYPAIREMHRASSLANGDEAKEWREAGPAPATRHDGRTTNALRPLEGSSESETSVTSTTLFLEQVIRKRGSSRRFRPEPIDFRHLSTALALAVRGVSADALPRGSTLSDPYLIVNGVNGLSPGSYAFHPAPVAARGALELLHEGDVRAKSRFLDLEQDLAGDASANLYVLVDLAAVLERYGNRGYRVAQIEGGLIGGRLYLASYALGLGASGLTFFDDAVTDFFSPHASGKAVMFLGAFGVPGRRNVLFQK